MGCIEKSIECFQEALGRLRNTRIISQIQQIFVFTLALIANTEVLITIVQVIQLLFANTATVRMGKDWQKKRASAYQN